MPLILYSFLRQPDHFQRLLVISDLLQLKLLATELTVWLQTLMASNIQQHFDGHGSLAKHFLRIPIDLANLFKPLIIIYIRSCPMSISLMMISCEHSLRSHTISSKKLLMHYQRS